MAVPISFEILSQPIVPGVPNIPYVQQGFFLQITNVGASTAQIPLPFFATPAFVASSGAVSLLANTIDQNGTVNQISANTFLAPPVGFPAIQIGSQQTWIVGVQYVLNFSQVTSLVGSTPQDSLGTRGYMTVSAQPGSTLLVLPTIRQVFNNYDTSGNLMDVAESAYAVPVPGGPLLSF